MISRVRELAARVASFLGRKSRDSDFVEEIAAHLDLATEDNIRRGMTPEEARRQALVSFGGIEPARERHRESRGLPGLESVLQDLRYGARRLRRDTGLAVFAVLIVGLGVGASCTVFSVVNALLLAPLPFQDPARLVWIANGESENLSDQTVQVSNVQTLVEQSRSFSGVAGFSPFYGDGDIRFTGDGEAERVTGVPVTRDFFPLLGVKPQIGRLFTAKECEYGAPKTLLLSHAFWHRRFQGSPGVIGRSITLDGDPATVIGVLPESFDFASTFTPGSRADLFHPYPLSAETNRRGNTLALIGRLKPDVGLSAAQSEATAIGNRIKSGRIAKGLWRNEFHPRLSALRQHVSGRFRDALFVLAGAVAFLMLLVCANLSNLLLARASTRRRELAIRTALGASRKRLVRQMLIESVLLSCAGTALGLALATVGTTLLSRLNGTNIPLLAGIRVDSGALAFTLSTAILTGIVFGLAPALQASADTPHNALKESGRSSTAVRSRNWMRNSLVVSEIALACVLVTGASLLVRSFVRVLDVDLGFEVDNVLALRVDPGRAYSKYEQKIGYFDRILAAVRSIPGVDEAGLTDALPLGDNFGWRKWTLKTDKDGEDREALVRVVDDAYFKTMRIALRAGRAFEFSDNVEAPPVVIINDELARTLWPGEDPIGRSLKLFGQAGRTVIGVAEGVHYFGLEEDSGAEMYLPIRQVGDFSSVDLVVRGRRRLSRLVPELRAALLAVDPNLPAAEFRTMRQLVDHSVFPRRFIVMLLAGFAAFALVLASLGIYGVISYTVTRQRREIGIRMALGATARELQWRVLAQTAKLALAGFAIGLPTAWVVARAIRGLLFGVTFSDPGTFAAALLMLSVVSLTAGLIPARRAANLNPLEALRLE